MQHSVQTVADQTLGMALLVSAVATGEVAFHDLVVVVGAIADCVIVDLVVCWLIGCGQQHSLAPERW